MSNLMPVPDAPAAEPLVSADLGDFYTGARFLRADGWASLARRTLLVLAGTGRMGKAEDRAYVVRTLGTFGLSAPG